MGEAPDPSDREGSALVPKSPAKTEVVELSKVLLELKLERYQRACDQCGYDHWQEIVEMNGGALDTLAARLKLAPNHAAEQQRRRLRALVTATPCHHCGLHTLSLYRSRSK